ncbi:MAG: hypothetical protein ABIG69_09250 [Bacteroidota bacterium]
MRTWENPIRQICHSDGREADSINGDEYVEALQISKQVPPCGMNGK